MRDEDDTPDVPVSDEFLDEDENYFEDEDDEYADVSDGTDALDDAVVIPVGQLRRIMELRQRRDETKKAADTAEKEYREAEADLYEQLENGPVGRLSNVDLGEPWGKVSFQKRKTDFGRVIKGMEDEAIAHYEKLQQTDAMTKPKLVMKRVNEDVRAALEEGSPLPPGIDYYTKRGVTVTRQKD